MGDARAPFSIPLPEGFETDDTKKIAWVANVLSVKRPFIESLIHLTPKEVELIPVILAHHGAAAAKLKLNAEAKTDNAVAELARIREEERIRGKPRDIENYTRMLQNLVRFVNDELLPKFRERKDRMFDPVFMPSFMRKKPTPVLTEEQDTFLKDFGVYKTTGKSLEQILKDIEAFYAKGKSLFNDETLFPRLYRFFRNKDSKGNYIVDYSKYPEVSRIGRLEILLYPAYTMDGGPYITSYYSDANYPVAAGGGARKTRRRGRKVRRTRRHR